MATESKSEERHRPTAGSSSSDPADEPRLAGETIHDRVDDGYIMIEPYHPGHLMGASYNIMLGNTYFRGKESKEGWHRPGDKESIQEYWGEPQEASVVKEDMIETLRLCPGAHYLFIAPGETILGHTAEFIGCGYGYVPALHERESIMQAGIRVRGYSGTDDHGVFSRWSLLITNESKQRVMLVTTNLIVSITFTVTHASSRQSRYRPDRQKIIDQWTPSLLLKYPYNGASQRVVKKIERGEIEELKHISRMEAVLAKPLPSISSSSPRAVLPATTSPSKKMVSLKEIDAIYDAED